MVDWPFKLCFSPCSSENLWRDGLVFSSAFSSVDTEALSQGCSSALLFRDNDKALNPSVDLTFVPSSIFKPSWALESCDLAGAGGGLGVCLGRGDSRSPPLFGLATPQAPRNQQQNTAWSGRYPESLCAVCYGGSRKWGERSRRSRVCFC